MCTKFLMDSSRQVDSAESGRLGLMEYTEQWSALLRFEIPP